MITNKRTTKWTRPRTSWGALSLVDGRLAEGALGKAASSRARPAVGRFAFFKYPTDFHSICQWVLWDIWAWLGLSCSPSKKIEMGWKGKVLHKTTGSPGQTQYQHAIDSVSSSMLTVSYSYRQCKRNKDHVKNYIKNYELPAFFRWQSFPARLPGLLFGNKGGVCGSCRHKISKAFWFRLCTSDVRDDELMRLRLLLFLRLRDSGRGIWTSGVFDGSFRSSRSSRCKRRPLAPDTVFMSAFTGLDRDLLGVEFTSCISTSGKAWRALPKSIRDAWQRTRIMRRIRSTGVSYKSCSQKCRFGALGPGTPGISAVSSEHSPWHSFFG